MPAPECTCPKTASLVGLYLEGQEIPTCPTHRPESKTAAGAAIALNNDAALAARIGAHLTKGNN